jgi:hypothetical protein
VKKGTARLGAWTLRLHGLPFSQQIRTNKLVPMPMVPTLPIPSPAAGKFRGGPVQTNSGPKKSKFDRLGAGADSSATVTGERGPCVARTARRCETLGLLRCLAVRFSCSISESWERAGDRLGPWLEEWAALRAAAGSARMSAYHSCQHSPSLPSEISM